MESSGSRKGRSAKGLFLAGVLIAALLAGLFLLSDAGGPTPAGLGGEEPSPAGPAPETLAAAEAPSTTTPSEEARRPVKEYEAYEIHRPYSTEWVVDVVRRVGGGAGGVAFEPVPGAWVRAIELDAAFKPFWLAANCPFERPPEEHFVFCWSDLVSHWYELMGISFFGGSFISLADPPAELGRSFQADGEGRVRLPWTLDKGALILHGHSGRERGCLMAVFGREQNFLELRPDSVLRIQVVDSQGRPRAGVPIHIQSCSWSPNSMPVLATQWPDGMVDVHGIRELLEAHPRSAKDPRLYVRLAMPLPEPVYAAIEPGILPVQPIRLVLPPTGSVRIEIPAMDREEGEWVLAGFEAIEPNPEAYLEDREFEPEEPPEAEGRDLPNLFEPGSLVGWARAQGGSVVFPYVGLGMDLVVHVVRYSPTGFCHGSQISKCFAGPVSPGQEVHLRIEGVSRPPLLTGRAVDERGEPMAGRQLIVSLDGDRRDWSKPNCTTDGSGHFRRFIPPKWPRKNKYTSSTGAQLVVPSWQHRVIDEGELPHHRV